MEVNGVSGGAGMEFASEVYGASIAKVSQEQQAQQTLDLLASAAEVVQPSASQGSHMTTDNLGQNININV